MARFRKMVAVALLAAIESRNGHAFTFGRPIVLARRVWTPRLFLGRTVVESVNAYIGDLHLRSLGFAG